MQVRAFESNISLMCRAQGHTAVPPVRLEPAVPRSWVKHSTTEPLRLKLIVSKQKK